jgi:hypothetical protein
MEYSLLLIAGIVIVLIVVYQRGKNSGKHLKEKEQENENRIIQMLGDRYSKAYILPYAIAVWEKTKDLNLWNSLVNEYIRKMDYLADSTKSLMALEIPYCIQILENEIKSDVGLNLKWENLNINEILINDKISKSEETKWLLINLLLQITFQQFFWSIELNKIRDGKIIVIKESFNYENQEHITNLFSELFQKKDEINKVVKHYLDSAINSIVSIQNIRNIEYSDISQQIQSIMEFQQK